MALGKGKTEHSGPRDMSRKSGHWGFTEEAKEWASRARRRDETADIRHELTDHETRQGPLDVEMHEDDTITLWRPTGPEELALVEAAGWSAWPPRLPEQPIFYPVLNEAYATKIARDWNVPRDGAGYVTRFKVQKSYLDKYEAHQVGGREHVEYWIPAEELDEFNQHLVGQIEVVAEFH